MTDPKPPMSAGAVPDASPPESARGRPGADEVETAAAVVVATALGLETCEKLVVVADAGSAEMGGALARAARDVDGWARLCWLDRPDERPHRTLPRTIVEEIKNAAACAFVASAPHQELGMRQHLLHLVRTGDIRHAHMPGISRLAFARGARIDYRKVAVLGQRMLEKLGRARTLESHSELGTHLGIELAPGTSWFAQLGVLPPGRWGNLPAGALYASPETVEGTFVANASLGEFFGVREGSLERAPVALTIERGRVQRVRCASKQLERDIVAMLGFSANSNRVGLVAVGVNLGITAPTGEALVDQNLPGLHLGIGDPAAKVTGADWSAPTSFAACQWRSTLVVEGAMVIHRGQLLTPS